MQLKVKRIEFLLLGMIFLAVFGGILSYYGVISLIDFIIAVFGLILFFAPGILITELFFNKYQEMRYYLWVFISVILAGVLSVFFISRF